MVSNQDKKDAEIYKKTAIEGMDLMFLVRIKGVGTRHDIGLPYHVTIMLFDEKNDKPEDAHKIATRLCLNPPNAKKTRIEFGTMQGRSGYTIYNINLMGPEADKIEKLYNEFSDMGFDNNYKFQAHISVDKKTFDEMQKYDGKTAFEAGIEFFPAELRMGKKIVASYKPTKPIEWGSEYPEEDKLHASENLDVATFKEALLMSIEIHKDHLKAVSFNEDTFKNYLQDNPDLKKHLLVKHEERANYHFRNDLSLLTFALENGIRKTYELLRKK